MTPTLRVLVLDHDRGHGVFLTELLVDAGHRATLVDDPKKAKALLKEGDFELLVTDLGMPNIDGVEFIDWVRAHDARIAIVAMTALGSAEVAVRSLRAGASDFLTKPFDSGSFLRRLVRAVENRTRDIRAERLRRDVEAHLERLRRK